MIRNYDDFVKKVVQTYVDASAPDIWKDIKYEESFKDEKEEKRDEAAVHSEVILMSIMNERLYKYKKHNAEKIVNDILSQIDGLNKTDKDELAYEMLNKLVECMRDTMWEYYWEEQLQNLTRNLDLNFTILED